MRRQWKPLLLTLVAAVVLVVAPAAAGAANDTCVPTCSVAAMQVAYVSAVTVVASGSTVVWEALDNLYHTATSADFALDARLGQTGSGDTGEGTFELREDGLWVSSDGGKWEFAESAVGLEGGAYALQYRCLFHSKTQQGVVIVTPAVPGG